MTEKRCKTHAGLADPRLDRDSCGIGFVAAMKGGKSHKIVQMGLEMLMHLEHRGACGCDPLTGDGAGILLQIPHAFFKKQGPKNLPVEGDYGVGMVFFPTDPAERKTCEQIFDRIVKDEGQETLGWRDVPVNPAECGQLSREVMPFIRQVFIGKSKDITDSDAFE